MAGNSFFGGDARLLLRHRRRRSDGGPAATVSPSPASDTPGDVVVTASRVDLLGRAATASEGSITSDEVALRLT